MKRITLSIILSGLFCLLYAQTNQNITNLTKKNPSSYYDQNNTAPAPYEETRAFILDNLPANNQGGSSRAVTTVQLGSAGNLFTILSGEVNRIAANSDLNTIVFIHRSNPDDFPSLPDDNIGQYRYDISTDGGATWTLNQGVLNPKGNQQTLAGRYPNVVVHNPVNNTDPDSAYLAYLGTWLPFDAGGTWDGLVAGVARLDNEPSTFTENIYTPNNGDIEIARGMCNGAPGIFWAVNWEWDEVEFSKILVFKGIWNSADNDVDWTMHALITPPFDKSQDGTSQATALNMAFDPTGQYGWISFLGDVVPGGDQYFQPVFYNSNDGGNTWNGPIVVDMASIENLVDGLPAGPPPTTAFDQDIVVDINGNPHMAAVVGTAGAGQAYSISSGGGIVNKLYDFTYNANAATGCGWQAILIDSLFTFRGDNIAGTVSEDNRPQASLSPDGKKVFFGWLDSDPAITGGGNELPDFHTRGWDVTTGLATPTVNWTMSDPVWEGGALFASTAPTCLENNGTYTIPTVFTRLNPSLLDADPTDFFYVQNIQYQESDFSMDIIPPAITLNGNSHITLLVGNPVNDPGVTAIDNVDGNITANVIVDSSGVNTNAAGLYMITYDVVDAAGNKACQAVRVVNVVNSPDVTPPAITLIGNTTITIDVCDFFADPGATATDNLDGNITHNIVVTSNVPSPLSPGTYSIDYNVSDGAGNAAPTATRTVIVQDLPPTIILFGDSVDQVEICNAYPDPGALAFDNCQGSVSVTKTGTVDINTVGSYTLTYTATDGVNPTVSKTRTVNVTPDVTPPSIGINGTNPAYVYLGTAFTDPGATAVDCVDGNLTNDIVSDAGSSVDEAVRGIYTVTYTVADAAGNTATVTRNVVVNTEPDPAFDACRLSSSNTIRFTDQSLYSPTAWLWTFGDDNGSTQPNPQPYTYSAAGTYNACLTVSNIFNDPPFSRAKKQACDSVSTTSTKECVVGIQENVQLAQSFNIYPNPTNGLLNIEIIDNRKFDQLTITVHDLLGKELQSFYLGNTPAQSRFSVDLSNGVQGVYLVRIHTDEGVITKRVTFVPGN